MSTMAQAEPMKAVTDVRTSAVRILVVVDWR
jgi:hypothetical protein